MSIHPVKAIQRRLRFSLRSLLVLIAAAAAGVGLVERRVGDLRMQRSVAAEIQRLGGYLRWETRAPAPAWLISLFGEDFFADVYLVECDSQLVGDGTLVHLERLRRLEWLMLDSDRITDQGVGRIANLRELRHLDLGSRRISDDGLASLQRLSNLRSLALRRTQITLAGLERLRRALPDCHFQWEPPSLPASPSPSPDQRRPDGDLDLAKNRLINPQFAALELTRASANRPRRCIH